MRAKRLRGVLRRFDIDLTPYRATADARRVKLLATAGVTQLVDIGANAGQWGENVRANGYRATLHSYEPAGAAYAKLAARTASDPTWHPHQAAVGDHEGTLDLHVSDNDLFSSALPMFARAEDAEAGARYVRTETVPLTTLDAIAKTVLDPGPFGVKMDVQGLEGQVIDGGRTALGRAAFLELELSLVPLYDGERLYRDMLGVMVDDLGFELAMVEPTFPDWATGRTLQINGLFLRPKRLM